MQPLDPYSTCPQAATELICFEECACGSALERPLIELIRVRVSQLNRCPAGIGRHWRNSLAEGVLAPKLQSLQDWGSADCFSERERAALTWAEAVVVTSSTDVPPQCLLTAQRLFSDEEIIWLTLVVAATAASNTFATSLRALVDPESRADDCCAIERSSGSIPH